MKQFLVFILSISLVSISCDDDNLVESNCAYSPEISEKYNGNAMNVLLTQMDDNPTHPDYSNLEFNQDSIDYILSALQAVKDLNTNITDSIFSEDFITYPRLSDLRSIYLSMDSSSDEAQSLLNMGISGNEEFDFLIENTGLELMSQINSNGNIQFVFATQNDCNLISVNVQFEEMSFVQYSSYTTYYTFFEDIANFQFSKMSNNHSRVVFKRYSVTDMYVLLIKHWIYEVDENCNAELVYSLNW
jgi:hypothetical protein